VVGAVSFDPEGRLRVPREIAGGERDVIDVLDADGRSRGRCRRHALPGGVRRPGSRHRGGPGFPRRPGDSGVLDPAGLTGGPGSPQEKFGADHPIDTSGSGAGGGGYRSGGRRARHAGSGRRRRAPDVRPIVRQGRRATAEGTRAHPPSEEWRPARAILLQIPATPIRKAM